MAKSDRRIIVLTGATRGLGKEMALGFAQAGHRVFGCGRSKELAETVKKDLGRGNDIAVVDVRKSQAVEKWAQRVIKKVGAPDLIINNAALMNSPAPLWKIPATEFDALVDVNVKGVANVIRAFLPAMIERGTGVIVNFSSGWGRGVSPEVAPYCATKFAIEGLTQALAEELPPGLSAVPVNPGIIDTDMLRQVWQDGASRFPKPADWARVAVPFLLSLGPIHNGQSLNVPIES